MPDHIKNTEQTSTSFVFRPLHSDADSDEVAARGRTPRISRMMALAIHLQGLVDSGEVADYAELARAGFVSRARVTQIMNLTMLAPDIQEEILFLPTIQQGRDVLSEKALRRIAASPQWSAQREGWKRLCSQFIEE